MGKAQSKRSIDITTDPKKVGEGDEVAGKVEKIEDGNQSTAPALNGEAAAPAKDKSEDAAVGAEKKETEENSEHDKDLTTEKNAAADVTAKTEGAAGDGEAAKDEAAAASPKEGSGAEEISPLSDDSIKSKSKKDKVKKKWSFRSISFGKKDKQKPAKTEEPVSPTAAAPAAATESAQTNGEVEERPAEAEGATAAPSAATAADNVEKSADATPAEAAVKDETLNGAASEQEKQELEQPQVNGDDKTAATPAPPAAAAAAAAAVTVASEEQVQPEATNTAAAVEEKSVPEPAEVVTNGHETVLTNGDKNGLAETPTNDADAPATNNVDEESQQHHQNGGGDGTNGVDDKNDAATPPPTPVAESEAELIKNKSQIEVKQTDNTNTTVNTCTTTTAVNTSITGTEIETVYKTETETETETKTETEIETETPISTIAAAEFVETPAKNQSNTSIANNTTTTNTTTTTTNTIDKSVSLPTSQAQPIQSDAVEEEQVVAAIIAAVSEIPDAEEGFVVVATTTENESQAVTQTESQADSPTAIKEEFISDVLPVPPQIELETESSPIVPESGSPAVVFTSVAAEVDLLPVEVNLPPPLPKSPPPSRVSAFALTTDTDETLDNNNDDHEDNFVMGPEKVKETAPSPVPAVAEQDHPTLADIEVQAHFIVDQITEKAADIVGEQDKQDIQDTSPITDSELIVTIDEITSCAVGIVTDIDADSDDGKEDKKPMEICKDEVLVERPQEDAEQSSNVEEQPEQKHSEIEDRAVEIPEKEETINEQSEIVEDNQVVEVAKVEPEEPTDKVISKEEQPETVINREKEQEKEQEQEQEREQEQEEELIVAVEKLSLRGSDDKETIDVQNVQDLEDMERVDNADTDKYSTIIDTSDNCATKLGALATEKEVDANHEDIAKDLKEKNAAADVTTQDITVTCED